MRVGVVFPQTEIGNDSGSYSGVCSGGGVAGVRPYSGLRPRVGSGRGLLRELDVESYRLEDAFHEPFVLFGFMAGLTKSIEFTTGIIILPQRQTALVAKQAAALDVLERRAAASGHRDWVEPRGVRMRWERIFRNRGRRSEEQIALLRELWTKEVVTFEGKWNRVEMSGVEPAAGAASDPDMVRGRVGAGVEANWGDGGRMDNDDEAGGAERRFSGDGGADSRAREECWARPFRDRA